MDAATAVLFAIVVGLLVAVLLVVLLRNPCGNSGTLRREHESTDNDVEPVFIYDITGLNDLENIAVRWVPGETIEIMADAVGPEPMLEFELPADSELFEEFEATAAVDGVEFGAIVRATGRKFRVLFGESTVTGTLTTHFDV